jgi:flagellar FliL protein
MKKVLKPVGLIVGGLALIGVLFMVVLPRVLGGPLSIEVGGAAEATTVTPVEPTEVVEKRGVPVSLGERVVNLADPGGFRYLKVEIVLSLTGEDLDASGLAGEKLVEEQHKLENDLAAVKPEIQDILTTVLTSKTVADVSTADGKAAVKVELMTRLAPLFHELEIADIYFAQFLIQ